MAGLDVTVGLRQAMGRDALYLKLLRRFVDGQADTPKHLASALENEDWTVAERVAHTLKGVAAQIGAGELRALAEQLEHAIRHRAPITRLETLQADIAASLPVLIEAIGARLPQQTSIGQAAPPVDPDRQHELCSRLASLLSNDDFACEQLFNENETLLRIALGDRFTRIAEAIHSYDFAAALDSLKEALAPQASDMAK
jgi:two-component system sensor histidine kinase/response regulator